MEGVGGHGPKKLTLRLTQRKRHFFVIEKHIEDVKQDEKSVPDLLESIIRPTDPVIEELPRMLFKMNQYRLEIIKIRASTFWMSGKSKDSRRRPTQPPCLVSFKPITAFRTPKNLKKNAGSGRAILHWSKLHCFPLTCWKQPSHFLGLACCRGHRTGLAVPLQSMASEVVVAEFML